MELLPGAYETIINAAIKERLNTIEPENTYVAKEDIDSSSSNDWLASYLANVVSSLLCEKFKDEKREKTGTQYIRKDKLSLVFVTTNKSDKDYSPTTLYKDYAINEHQFHWQSKNDIRIESEAGQQFIHQKENGWRFLLFVRESKNDEFGNTNGYHCLGLMDFNKSEGECPMNITWDMKDNIPGFILQNTQAI